VCPEGRPVELSSVGCDRVVTLVERQERPLAALIHDPAVANHPRLISAVRAAAGLGLENEQLHAALRARLDEVSASRRRILDAAEAERRRIERNLHDGAQQRLVSVSLTLGLALAQLERNPELSPRATATVSRALDELRRALDDLRDLARGIHPAILVQQGLLAAVTSLAEAAPLPVRVRISSLRYPPLTESIAYYVACEAVANAVRHAQASWVEVRVEARGLWLYVDVVDNGIGGTDIERGTGLRGLADRVAALGGRFEVKSPYDQGTCVHAELPCGPSVDTTAGQRSQRDPDGGSLCE
jgi:signal transduction histidine kinase